MRFIFINRFYWPDEPATAQLLADLAETLVKMGHSVTVIASRPARAPRVETRRGVAIRRVRGTRWSRSGLPGKAADFISFYAVAMFRLLATARSGDIVVALTDPPLLGIGAWLVARLRGGQVVHWVQDIYPEVAITLTGQRWLGFVRPLRDLAWRRAEACVTLGTDMARVLQKAGVKPHRLNLIPNWAPNGISPQPATAATALRREWGLSGKFVVLYSGNLGRVHDLEPLIAVAERLLTHTHIALVLVGSGARQGALMAEASARGLTNIQFHPAQPRARLAETLALGDIHLVTLRPGCEFAVFPSKLYGIAAVGRPVLFIGPAASQLAELVRQRGFGLTFTRDEIEAQATAISNMSINPAECARMSRAAERFGAESGDAARAARQWAALAVSLDGA